MRKINQWDPEKNTTNNYLEKGEQDRRRPRYG
jgi:hypothetical protein